MICDVPDCVAQSDVPHHCPVIRRVGFPTYRVLVFGGRTFGSRVELVNGFEHRVPVPEEIDLLNRTLSEIHHEPNDPRGRIRCIIHGACAGADLLARDWAAIHGIPCDAYPADWERYGKKAGPIRNQQMLDIAKPDLAVGFPGGRGTADMAARCKHDGVKLIEVRL